MNLHLQDNIPGVKGIGPKTACALLNHFKSLDNLFTQIDLMVATSEDWDEELFKPKKIPKEKKAPKVKAKGKGKGKGKGKKGDVDEEGEGGGEGVDGGGLGGEVLDSEGVSGIEGDGDSETEDSSLSSSPPPPHSPSLTDPNRDMKINFFSELKTALSTVQSSAGGTLKKLKTSTLSEVTLFKRLVTLRDDVHIEDLHGPLLPSLSSSSSSSSPSSLSSSPLSSSSSLSSSRPVSVSMTADENNNIDNSEESDIVIKAIKKKKEKKEKKIETDTAHTEENPSQENDGNSAESVDFTPILFPEIINGRTQDLDSRLSNVDSSHFLYVGERDGAEQILSGMSSSFITPLSLLRLQYHKLERTLG